MNKYENYKKVEIPWVRKIPTHWRIERNKNIFIKTKSVVGIQSKTTDLLSLTTKGIKVKSKDQIGGKQPSSYERYQFVNKDNLVLCLFDLDCSAVFSDVSQYNGMISPAYDVFKVKKQIPQYYKYLFSYLFQDRVYKIYSKSVRYTINEENFNTLLTLVPPIAEQEHIANYLDWKIREIDKLIEIEKQQIKDIERLKKNIISQYYIKLPIKRRIKTLIQSPLVYGINEAGKMNGKIRFVRITDIEKNGSLKKDGKQYINDCEKKYILEKGDILFARSGGTVGKTYLHQDISNNELMAFAGYLIRARFDVNLVNPEYIYYYTQSESYTEWKNSIFIQSTIQNISAEKYSNLEIPYCSLNIQNKIVERIKQKLLEITKLKEKSLEKQLYLVSLKESIISEVVTGQIDVRNVKIPEIK